MIIVPVDQPESMSLFIRKTGFAVHFSEFPEGLFRALHRFRLKDRALNQVSLDCCKDLMRTDLHIERGFSLCLGPTRTLISGPFESFTNRFIDPSGGLSENPLRIVLFVHEVYYIMGDFSQFHEKQRYLSVKPFLIFSLGQFVKIRNKALKLFLG